MCSFFLMVVGPRGGAAGPRVLLLLLYVWFAAISIILQWVPGFAWQPYGNYILVSMVSFRVLKHRIFNSSELPLDV